MIEDCGSLTSMKERILSQKINLGENHNYAIEGIGKTFTELESSNNLPLSNVLYVPGLRNNLVSISFFEDKGDRIEFLGLRDLV